MKMLSLFLSLSLSLAALADGKFLYFPVGRTASQDGQIILAAFGNETKQGSQLGFRYVRVNSDNQLVTVSDPLFLGDGNYNQAPDIRGYGPSASLWSSKGVSIFDRANPDMVATKWQSRKNTSVEVLVRAEKDGKPWYFNAPYSAKIYRDQAIAKITEKAKAAGYKDIGHISDGDTEDMGYYDVTNKPQFFAYDTYLLSDEFDLETGLFIKISADLSLGEQVTETIDGKQQSVIPKRTAQGSYETIVKLTLDKDHKLQQEVVSSTVNFINQP